MLTKNPRGFGYRELLIPALSILLVSGFTYFIKLLLPAPSESVDKIIVATWWISPFLIALFARAKPNSRWLTFLFGGAGKRDLKRNGIFTTALFYALTGAAALLVVIAIFWKRDPLGFYRGFTILDFLFGLGICALIYFGFWGRSARLANWLLVAAVLGIEILALPTYFQWPGNIADGFHFPFTTEEISAVAVGHFPYSNFIPQYTALLGYPISPVINLWKSHSLLITTGYFTFLQVLCVAIAVLLPVLVGGRRMAGAAALLVAFPPLILMREVDRPLTYFATFPIRIIIPMVLILLTFLWISRSHVLDRTGKVRLIGVGVFGGATLFNNLDYGIPAFCAVTLTLFLSQPEIRRRILAVLLYWASAILPFMFVYIAGWISGNSVHWSYMVTFARIFGAENYMAVPIDKYGLHVAFVSLFVAVTSLGIILLVRSAGRNNFAARQGALLTLVGSFSLLSTVYFSSRSLVPTLISGYSFQVGACCAALLPLIRFGVKAHKMKLSSLRTYSLATSLFAILAIAPGAGTVLLIGNPSHNLSQFVNGKVNLNYPKLQDLTLELESSLAGAAIVKDVTTFNQNYIWQIAPMPSAIELQTGFRSAALTSNSDYFVLADPIFRKLQCAALQDNLEAKYLVLERRSALALDTEPVCRALFDFPGQNLAVAPSDLVLLTRIPGK